MIIKCGKSAQGASHKRQGIDCQDNNAIYEEAGIAIAAIADGLSSSRHSDEASEEAAKFVVNYCKNHIKKISSEEDITTIIKQAFEETQTHIELKAREQKYELDECDTTLCLAVFFNGDLYYGQAGDSGIIAFREDGIFERVTEIVIDEEGYVDPLCRSDKWIIKKYPHKVRSLLLVTDGIWHMLVPSLLNNQQYPLDHEVLSYYLNNKELEKIDQDKLDKWLSDDITDILPDLVNHDDKTMVILIDTDITVTEQNKAYYEWPGEDKWTTLLKHQEADLYKYRSQNAEENNTANADVFEKKQKNITTKKSTISKKLKNLNKGLRKMLK